MLIKSLLLTNFRNFAHLNLTFDKTVLFLGKNAQGKSNILESIYVLSTTKSPRAERDVQLIKNDADACYIEGKIDQDGEENVLSLAMQKREEMIGSVNKRVKVNGVAKRVLDYIGNLVVVHFSPEDINLVSGSPSLRRWHIDLTLAQADREYKRATSRYSEVLVSRNRLLKMVKEGLAKINELDFWNKELLLSGILVQQKRRYFFETILSVDGYSFIYHPSAFSVEKMAEHLPREIAATTSLSGPHRDDFTFLLNNKNLAHFGSRGEQRSAVLNLKIAELNFFKQIMNKTPILLLDDVFSELDSEHRDRIIDEIKNQQTIISAVETEQIPDSFLQSVQVLRVDDGVVQ